MNTDARRHVHLLIDRLPPMQLAALKLALAPPDDEPFTEEDRLAVAEADEWRRRNDPIPLEAVLADFGLNMADWDKMGQTSALDEHSGKG